MRACPCATRFLSGSLIPRQPFGGGRNATQSASRGSLVVQCWPDYKVANRWYGSTQNCHQSLFVNMHIYQAIKGGKEKRNGNRYPSRATYSSSLFTDIFHWRELNPIDDLPLLYKAAKARIWLKLPLPISFQLFI